MAGVGGDIIVIDNASQDGTPGIVEGKFPTVRVIRNTMNEGFARAANKGIRVSRGSMVLLLNPDTVTFPGVVRRCLEFLDAKQDVGIVGVRVLDEAGRPLIGLGHPLPSVWGKICEQLCFAKLFFRAPWMVRYVFGYPDMHQPHEVDFVAGCFLMIRSEVLQSIGLLDEGMFLFGEDVDICWRAKNGGWGIWLLGDVEVLHLGHASTRQDVGGSLFEHYKAEEQLLVKHFSTVDRFLIRATLATGAVFRLVGWWAKARFGAEQTLVAEERCKVYALVVLQYLKAFLNGTVFLRIPCVTGMSSLSAGFLTQGPKQ